MSWPKIIAIIPCVSQSPHHWDTILDIDSLKEERFDLAEHSKELSVWLAVPKAGTSWQKARVEQSYSPRQGWGSRAGEQWQSGQDTRNTDSRSHPHDTLKHTKTCVPPFPEQIPKQSSQRSTLIAILHPSVLLGSINSLDLALRIRQMWSYKISTPKTRVSAMPVTCMGTYC